MNKHYIYFHYYLKDKKWILFYVGRGSKYNYKRAKESHNSQKLWKQITSTYKWKWKKIGDNLSLQEAIRMEESYIEKYGRIGYEKDGILINRQIRGGGGSPLSYSIEYMRAYHRKWEAEHKKDPEYKRKRLEYGRKHRKTENRIKYCEVYNQLLEVKERHRLREIERRKKFPERYKEYQERSRSKKGMKKRIKLTEEEKKERYKQYQLNKQKEYREQGYYNTIEYKQYQKEYREKKKLEKL